MTLTNDTFDACKRIAKILAVFLIRQLISLNMHLKNSFYIKVLRRVIISIFLTVLFFSRSKAKININFPQKLIFCAMMLSRLGGNIV